MASIPRNLSSLSLSASNSILKSTAIRSFTSTTTTRFSSQHHQHQPESSSSSSIHSDQPAPIPESSVEAQPEEFEQPQIQPVKYPYYVSRAGVYEDSLPVYTDVRHGGQSVFTILRRVSGNVEALRQDLLSSLPSLLEPTPLPRFQKPRAGRTIEPQYPTKSQPIKSSKVGAVGKIVIRGDRRREVREWLEERGF